MYFKFNANTAPGRGPPLLLRSLFRNSPEKSCQQQPTGPALAILPPPDKNEKSAPFPK
ncbi:hypothetical protein TNCV_856191, partial [Trichonephila clavipes]